MAEDISGSASWEASITAPSDGDTSWGAPLRDSLEKLSNRTQFLYGNQISPVVDENTVSVATNIIEFTGLSHSLLNLEINTVNDDASDADYYIYINGNETNSDYKRKSSYVLGSGTDTVAISSSDPSFGGCHNAKHSRSRITIAVNDGKLFMFVETSKWSDSSAVDWTSSSIYDSVNTYSSIISIKLFASQSSGFGVDSNVKILDPIRSNGTQNQVGGNVIINEDFTGASIVGGTVGGDATFDAVNDWVQLTPDSASQYGYLYWDEYTTVNFTAEIEFYITSNTGADATVFYWGCSTPASSSGNCTGWAVEFDEFNNNIELGYNNSVVASKTSTQPNSGWNTATISQIRDRITVSLNGVNVITYSGAEQNPFVGTIVGASARTGGSTNEHRVRLVKLIGYPVPSQGKLYSETEQMTSDYWIDGKPVYRKVVSLGTLPNATSKDVAHGISGLDTLVRIYGNAYRSDTGTRISLPFADPTSNSSIGLYWLDSTDLRIVAGVNRTAYTEAYAILEYTKT